MGCCLSTGENHHSSGEAPPIEKEMVKEVLLETPILPKTSIPNVKSTKKLVDSQDCISATNLPLSVSELKDPNAQKKQSKKDQEIIVSEVSETCSFSESLSVSNTTVHEKNDGEEVNQKIPLRKRQCQGGVTRKTPLRRHDVPSLQRKSQAHSSRTIRRHGKNLEVEHSVKRDSGHISGRRQKLPAAGCPESDIRQNVNEGVKKNGNEMSLRQNGSELVQNGRKSDAGKAREDLVLEDPEAESFENPVVSLECFIFL